MTTWPSRHSGSDPSSITVSTTYLQWGRHNWMNSNINAYQHHTAIDIHIREIIVLSTLYIRVWCFRLWFKQILYIIWSYNLVAIKLILIFIRPKSFAQPTLRLLSGLSLLKLISVVLKLLHSLQPKLWWERIISTAKPKPCGLLIHSNSGQFQVLYLHTVKVRRSETKINNSMAWKMWAASCDDCVEALN